MEENRSTAGLYCAIEPKPADEQQERAKNKPYTLISSLFCGLRANITPPTSSNVIARAKR
jgi:hypothetical protein